MMYYDALQYTINRALLRRSDVNPVKAFMQLGKCGIGVIAFIN